MNKHFNNTYLMCVYNPLPGMSIDALPYEFQPVDTVTALLTAAIERERKNAVPDAPSIPPLVGGLAQRLQRREAEISQMKEGEQWANGAREAKKDPLEYMELCRKYLAKMDTQGWNRSYHQRLFHDDFLKACTRSFWKLEKPGQFARDHQKVLRCNNWDHVSIFSCSLCLFLNVV